MWYYDEAKCRQWRLVVILGRSIRPCCSTVACSDTWLIQLIPICDSYFIVAPLLPLPSKLCVKHSCDSQSWRETNVRILCPIFPRQQSFHLPSWRAAECCREFESWFVNTSLASGNNPSTPALIDFDVSGEQRGPVVPIQNPEDKLLKTTQSIANIHQGWS